MRTVYAIEYDLGRGWRRLNSSWNTRERAESQVKYLADQFEGVALRVSEVEEEEPILVDFVLR